MVKINVFIRLNKVNKVLSRGFKRKVIVVIIVLRNNIFEKFKIV